jgi:Na+-exporting ATPase
MPKLTAIANINTCQHAVLEIQSWIEGGVIAGIIGLNIVVGFFQEYAAEKTMSSLRSLTTPSGTVSRDGNTAVIPAIEIVPGILPLLQTRHIKQ